LVEEGTGAAAMSATTLHDGLAKKQRELAAENARLVKVLAGLDEGEPNIVGVAFYERAVGLFHASDADGHQKPATANRLLYAMGLDARSKLDTDAEADTVLDALRGAAEPRDKDGNDEEFEWDLEASNDEPGYREELRRLVSMLQKIDGEDRAKSAHGTQAPAGGPSWPATKGEVRVTSLTTDEKRDERFAKCAEKLKLQVPAPTEFGACYQPSRGLALEFAEKKSMGAPHSLPKLDALLGKGRAQEVMAGRESALADMKSVMLGLRLAYANEMPGLGPDAYRSSDGKTRFNVEVDDGAGGKKIEKRAPVVSAHVVDEVIQIMDSALHPLSDAQVREICAEFWADFQGRALAAGMGSRPLSAALMEAASCAESVLTRAARMTRVEASTSRPVPKVGVGTAKDREVGAFDVSGLAPCPTWVETGACAAHENGRRCRNYRHFTGDIKEREGAAKPPKKKAKKGK
jgi:hypothetical protein